ncbi:C-reactive protein isoform X3 [Bos mutus]|uniref:C-reactive protein isoform X3 n=1 Tax=Bos mutus TaxID=72004 RepID=UPI0038B6AA73
MERLLWCFLVLISFSSVSGQTDLHKKAFVFPKETENSYVSLKTQLRTPLKAFTVCLYFYTELASTLSPNVLNWQALNYEAKGEVFIKPQLW